MIQRTQRAALVVALLSIGICPALAQFSENFDAGTAAFTVNDPYWLDQARANGYIIQTTSSVVLFPGFGSAIPNDVSGPGYFLFTGTAAYGPASFNIPPGQDEFYISPAFAVSPNTNYDVRFFLSNANTINNGQIQPEIDGLLLGAPVSAAGTFGTTGWQPFSFSWNSGSSTSATLILHDRTQTPRGNDFGLDAISVVQAAVPEPSSIALLSAGAVCLKSLGRRRRR